MVLSANANLCEPATPAGINPAMFLDRTDEKELGYSMNLRAFIDALSKRGELKRITRLVDWRLELGEITRSHRQPLLFENIKDYPGLRVFSNGLSSFSSIALALGLQPEKGRKAATVEVRRRVAIPVKPVMVSNGPVLENAVEGPDINLLEFPIPQWSKYDAGRYIGTWHANVTRDPETGTRNLGVYRMQVLGRNQTTVSTFPRSHLFRHLVKAEKNGHPLEMAVVIGAAEPVVMAAGAAYPCGSDEYDLAGSLAGQGIPLIKCKTVNLEVPAEAEIVIEGLIKPGVRVQDGPYFDYAGKPTTNPEAFVFEATRLMFRSRPIFRGAAVGHVGAEDQQLFSLLAEMDLFDFHDSRPRHKIQSRLVKERLFRLFQLLGRMNAPAFLRKIMKRSATIP